MSIRTGQTSKHAPHSDDANGSDAVCLSTGCFAIPRSWGVRIAPIGPGIDRAVGLAAGPLVDRADVEAGRAADAAQRLPPDRVGQHVGPAVVEQDRGGTPAARRRA